MCVCLTIECDNPECGNRLEGLTVYPPQDIEGEARDLRHDCRLAGWLQEGNYDWCCAACKEEVFGLKTEPAPV